MVMKPLNGEKKDGKQALGSAQTRQRQALDVIYGIRCSLGSKMSRSASRVAEYPVTPRHHWPSYSPPAIFRRRGWFQASIVVISAA
jgi:hypothetical protein